MTDNTPTENKSVRIIRLPEVLARTGLSSSTIYELINKRLFPHPVNLGTRAVGWIEGEISEWIAARITASRIK